MYHIVSHYLIKGTISKKSWNLDMFFMSPQHCLKHFSFKEEISELSCLQIYLHVKYPLLFSYFNEAFIFLDKFSKDTEISNITKIIFVGYFHADGSADRQTDRHDEVYEDFS